MNQKWTKNKLSYKSLYYWKIGGHNLTKRHVIDCIESNEIKRRHFTLLLWPNDVRKHSRMERGPKKRQKWRHTGYCVTTTTVKVHIWRRYRHVDSLINFRKGNATNFAVNDVPFWTTIKKLNFFRVSKNKMLKGGFFPYLEEDDKLFSFSPWAFFWWQIILFNTFFIRRICEDSNLLSGKWKISFLQIMRATTRIQTNIFFCSRWYHTHIQHVTTEKNFFTT